MSHFLLAHYASYGRTADLGANTEGKTRVELRLVFDVEEVVVRGA